MVVDKIASNLNISAENFLDDLKDWGFRNAKWVVAGLTIYLAFVAVRKRV